VAHRPGGSLRLAPQPPDSAAQLICTEPHKPRITRRDESAQAHAVPIPAATLQGRVERRERATRVHELAGSVDGVVAVHDRLTVPS
jgi:hypothetical protein